MSIKEEAIKFLEGMNEPDYLARVKDGEPVSKVLEDLALSNKYNVAQSLRLAMMSSLAKATEAIENRGKQVEKPTTTEIIEKRKVIKPFRELEREHWCTEKYHRNPLLNFLVSDGVMAFMTEYDAGWVIDSIMKDPNVRSCKYGRYPRVEVSYRSEELHDVKMYYGKVDENGEDLKDERPFDCAPDLDYCLPEGKLIFEVGIGDDKGTPVICLLSEH